MCLLKRKVRCGDLGDKLVTNTQAQAKLTFWVQRLAITCAVFIASLWIREVYGSASSAVSSRLEIRVGDREVASLVHGTPDVYLSGVIDSDAPARFSAMVKSGQVPEGSNIYLNSPGGDLMAGLALGRLFRAAQMTTFIGRPVFMSSNNQAQVGAVLCASACAYAYLGGMWRWAPRSGAPLGFTSSISPIRPQRRLGKSKPRRALSLLTCMRWG